MISIVILLAADRVRVRSLTVSNARLEAVSTLATRLVTSHLWVEEYVTGDVIDFQVVYDDLDWCLGVTSALLGAEHGIGALPVPELEPTAHSLRSLTRELGGGVETFRRLAASRHSAYDNQQDVGVGSPADVEFDTQFAATMEAAEQLRLGLAMDRQATSVRSQRQLLTIIAGWMLVIVGASLGLWSRERQRLRIEAELESSRRHLSHSQKMDTLGQLAGSLAHDLSNYLAAIRGHCELITLQGAQDPDRTRARLETVLDTIDRTTDLLDRLLALTKRRPAQREVVDLGTMLRQMTAIIEPVLGETIRLDLVVPDDPLPIEVDRGQLEQAILNLLVNARDAMPSGGCVTLEASQHDHAAGPLVSLDVADDGTGIAPEALDLIFEPLYTSREGDKHTGLGLAVVYRAVTQNGGRIEVDSRVGEGSRFRLFFPRASREAPAPARLEPDEPDVAGSETLLLVDDNDDYLQATRSYLEALGYHVLTARSGGEALDVCEQLAEEIDLVITDRVMPGLDGPGLRDRVESRWGLPTLMVSGQPEEEPSGSAPTIAKQRPTSHLAREVRRILEDETSRSGRPAAADRDRPSPDPD